MSRSPGDQNGLSIDPLLGRLLDDRYRLESLVGRGGMGSVYRALDVRLDRSVAVKVLRDPDGTDEERFAAEVRTLARFAHPNLVRLLDAGELDIRPYLVMELIEGETLAHRISRGALSDHETARIGAGVAGALAYVHEQGIVHRDVKPANVLLGEKGDAHLADFGIARLVDTTGITAIGFTLGTPAYLAPEQVQGAAVGPPADVYALGLVLLECLSGRRAFEGTASEITAARLQHDPELPVGIDALWRDVLGSMTQRRPADRLSAEQVASRLAPRALIDGLASERPGEQMSTTGTTMLLPGSGTGDTVRLEPTMTDVAAIVVGPTKIATAGSIGRLDFVRSLGRRSAVVAFGIVILVLFLGLLLGGVFSGTPRGGGPPAALSTSSSTSSSTTSSTTTTSVAPASVASAAGSLVAVLTAGVTNGTVATAAGQQLDNQLQPLLFSAQSESAAQQVDQFDQLVQSFDQDVANGQIIGNSTRLLRRAINRVAVALGTTVPTVTSTPTPTTTSPTTPAPTPPGRKSGPGNGPGKGRGKH
jgi:serine/threonine protein kinase